MSTTPATLKRSRLAFRVREPLFLLLYLLGFLAPWERSGSRATLWLGASTWAARSGWLNVETATFTVTFLALVSLMLGAILRVWATAYLGAAVATGRMVTAGPYGLVRNPLSLGSWLLALGTSILMPSSGAVFFLASFSLFSWLLIVLEERELQASLGDAYLLYRTRIGRLLPKIGRSNFVSPARPRWLETLLRETYPVTFSICFAIFAWQYNARFLLECLLICYGVSLVVRAITKPPAQNTDSVVEGTPGKTG